MNKFSWRKAALVAAVVPMMALSACSSSGGKPADSGNAGGGGQAASTARMKVALITHAAPGDTFWDIVRKGAEEAAAKDNVELLYTSDPEGGRQAQLVQQAIDQKVDGIAVTLAKPDALKDVLKKATDAGIPDCEPQRRRDPSPRSSARSPTSVRMRSSPAQAVGTKLAAAGFKHPICVIQEQGHVGLEAAVRRREGQGPRHRDPVRRRHGHDRGSVHGDREAAGSQGRRRHHRPGRPDHADASSSRSPTPAARPRWPAST